MAVIGGMTRIEGAWVGALAFIAIDNEVTNDIPASGLPVIGGSFNTIIGVIFLAIVVISPNGLMGIWDRLVDLVVGKGGGGSSAPALGEQTEAVPGS
jgi:branched-chain amino acid transport system permease protein